MNIATIPSPARQRAAPVAWRAEAGIALLLCAVAVASRMVWFGDATSEPDEQLYSLIGWNLLDGLWPYDGLWDRKPLGLFALFAFAHALGGPGPLAYQLLATAFAAAGAWLVYRLAQGLADRRTAIGAGVLYPPLIYAYGSFSGQSEVFLAPLLLGALLLVRDMPRGLAARRAAGAMLLAGMALQIKYSVLPQCAFLGLAALWRMRECGPARLVRQAAIFAILGLLPTLFTAAIYAARGEFEAFWFANFASITLRVAAASGRLPPEHLPALAPLIALSLGGLYAAFRARPRPPRAGYLLILGWSLSILAGIYMLGTVYLYYFAAFVPAAILLAVPLLAVRPPLGWVPMALAIMSSVLLLNLPRHAALTREGRAGMAELRAAIAPQLGAGRCLFVFDGPTALYRETGSCLPTRFIYPDHLNNPLERFALGVSQEGEVARILRARPAAIVLARDTFADRSTPARRLVSDTVRSSYRLATVARIREREILAFLPDSPDSLPQN